MNGIKRLPILQHLLDVPQRCIEFTLSFFQRFKLLNLFLYAASLAILSYLVMVRYSHRFDNLTLRVPILLIFILGGTILLKASGIKGSWGEFLVSSLVFLAVALKIATFSSHVSTYPFSLNWSEGNRYYYASLYFSEIIYGFSIPLPTLNPSQYLLQSIPFLLPDIPIWFHRLWQVFLWNAITFITAFLLARRLSITDQLRRWVFIAWTFLFLLLGPTIYNLQVPIILILLLFNPRRFWQSMGAVLLASIWAGISRINWFPVPGLLAATLYILEEPIIKRTIRQYWLWPALWIGAGIGIAFASQTSYIVLSDNPIELFASSFTSDLLWYRLLPNPTFPLGVLPQVLLVSFPFLLIIAGQMKGQWKVYHPSRLIGLTAILLVVFIGGLVVSAKIGGGSNIHNLDAYFVLLLVVTAYIYFGDFITERADGESSITNRRVTTVGLILALLLPVYISTNPGTSLMRYNQAEIENALDTINWIVNNAQQKGDEALFIDERQLLTFNYVENTPMIPEYEKIMLMEMAMAGNAAYFKDFYKDLANRRFGLIISEPLFTKLQSPERAFAHENNAWVKWVSEPVLCYYEPMKKIREFKIHILIPREDPIDCPL